MTRLNVGTLTACFDSCWALGWSPGRCRRHRRLGLQRARAVVDGYRCLLSALFTAQLQHLLAL